MLRFLIFAIACQFCVEVFAQQCTHEIRGVVSSAEGEKLPGATVRILNTTSAVVTLEDGTFSFQKLCHGEYTLSVEFIGFETQRVEISVPQQSSVSILLQPSTTQLKDVVIEGEKRQTGVSQTTFLLDKSALTLLHGRPLGESLKEIPGVSVIQTGPSIFKPVIHGLHSQRILILNNGIRQEGQQWGIEHAPEVDPYIASNIEVVKGAETVRYGSDAIGGVIIVNPPPLHEVKQLGGELNFGMMSNNRMGVISGMLEGNLRKGSKWSWRVQSSAKKGGDYHTPKYNLSNTGTEELNVSAAIGFQDETKGFEAYISSFNTEIGILRAAHTENLNDLQSSIESERPWYVEKFRYEIDNPKQKINHQLLKLRSYFQLKDFGRLNILYGAQYNQRQEFDIRRGGRGDRPALSLSLLSNVVDVSVDHEKGSHSGSIGVNGTLKYNTNDTGLTGIRPLIPDYQQTSGGIFFLEKLKKEKFTLEAGGRYDFQHLQVFTFDQNQNLLKPQFNFNFFSGTAGVSYRFNEHLRIISNLGVSSRPPHVSEMYSEGLHHGTGSIEEGLMRSGNVVLTDQDLIKKEMSTKWINTLQYTGEKVSFDFSLYYNAIDNYVFIHPYETRLTIRGYFPVFRFDQTNAVLKGGDMALHWDLSKRWSYSGKFSYIYAEDKTNGDVLIFIPPAQLDNGFTFHLPDVGSVRQFDFTVSVPLTLKQTRAPRVVYPGNIPDDTSSKTFDLAPAPDAYFLVNARLSMLVPWHERDIRISLSGENILNRTYRNYMNRLRYFADETGSNYILRVSYNFFKH